MRFRIKNLSKAGTCHVYRISSFLAKDRQHLLTLDRHDDELLPRPSKHCTKGVWRDEDGDDECSERQRSWWVLAAQGDGPSQQMKMNVWGDCGVLVSTPVIGQDFKNQNSSSGHNSTCSPNCSCQLTYSCIWLCTPSTLARFQHSSQTCV